MQKLNNYIKKGIVIIYTITTVMICVGLLADMFNFRESFEIIFYYDLVFLIIVVISYILYFIKKLKLTTSYAIIIYASVIDIIFAFLVIPYGEVSVLFFLRNSLLIVFLFTLAALTIGKNHGLIITFFYLIFSIYYSINTDDYFLKDSAFMILSLLAAYSLVVYFFVDVFEKAIHKQTEDSKIIVKQNEQLNESNDLLTKRQKLVEEQSEELKVQKEELTRVNNELSNLVATKDKFFSIIAHDLKSPFNSLMGLSELLYKKYMDYDDKKRIQLLKTINESAINNYDLLENMLTWARMQTGGIQLNQQNYNLYRIIDEAIGLNDNSIRSKNLNIFNKVDQDQFAFIDQYMISSVVNNLLSNAIKFTSNGGSITATTVLIDSKYVQVCIEDSGVGIPEENIQKLFRIDQSFSTTGTNKEKGTGLGLLLCKEFVEKNGGKIWVKSVFGKGSKFYFTIPVATV